MPIGSGTDSSLLSSRSALYSKPYDSRNAPWWKKSSPIQVSVIGAWGEMALTAGCVVDAGHGREEAGVGHAEDADAAVVVGDVLEQPLDRVVGVAGLVHPGRIRRIVERPVHEELPLAAVAAADVLGDEDVAVGREEAVVVTHDRIAGDAVRRAREQERQRVPDVAWRADAGVEVDAVTDGDLDEAAGVGCGRQALRDRWMGQQGGEQEEERRATELEHEARELGVR